MENNRYAKIHFTFTNLLYGYENIEGREELVLVILNQNNPDRALIYFYGEPSIVSRVKRENYDLKEIGFTQTNFFEDTIIGYRRNSRSMITFFKLKSESFLLIRSAIGSLDVVYDEIVLLRPDDQENKSYYELISKDYGTNEDIYIFDLRL